MKDQEKQLILTLEILLAAGEEEQNDNEELWTWVIDIQRAGRKEKSTVE